MPKFISLKTFNRIEDDDTSEESTTGNQPQDTTIARPPQNVQPDIPVQQNLPLSQSNSTNDTPQGTFTRIRALEIIHTPTVPIKTVKPASPSSFSGIRARQAAVDQDETHSAGSFSRIRDVQKNATQAGKSFLARAKLSYAGISTNKAPQNPTVTTEPLKLPDQVKLPSSLIPQPLPLPGKPLRPPMSEDTLKRRSSIRPPVVIHADMQRFPDLNNLEPGLGIPDRTRSTIVLTAVGLLFLVAFLSLVPINSGQSALTVFTTSIGWSQRPQTVVGFDAAIPAQQATPTPVPQAAANLTTTLNNPPAPIVVLSTSQYVAVAQQAAASAGIPSAAFVRQIQAESGFNPNAVSPGGAVGIAQFMPSTAAGLGINPYDPVSALNGAAKYMARLSNSFGGNYAKGLAAYNAGSGAVQAAINAGGANWLSYMNGTTQQYVARIMG